MLYGLHQPGTPETYFLKKINKIGKPLADNQGKKGESTNEQNKTETHRVEMSLL